jgi:hypothetical protein
VAILAGMGAIGAAEPAGAAVTTFTMSPGAGPPGTVVHVRGRGCAPGVLGSRTANFVTVTATTLAVAFRVPVHADGSWSGAFTVPEGATASSAPVDAACVSSNVLSLTTVYTPKAFRVTGSPPTTRPEPPTTGEPSPGTVFLPGDPATVIGVPMAADQSDGAPLGTSAKVRHRGAGATTSTAPGDAHRRASEPATLEPASVDTRSAAGTDAGLGWLGWTVVALLLLTVLGASGYLWRARHLRDAMPGGSV